MRLCPSSFTQCIFVSTRLRRLEQHDIAGLYPELSPEEQIEEAIAEAYGEWASAQRRWQDGPAKRAFQKIRRLMAALKRVLTGKGYETAEDLFGAALAGEIGKRRPENTGQRAVQAAQESRNGIDVAQALPRPVVRLTGRELGPYDSTPELGRAAFQWYEKNLKGSTVTNRETGWPIGFRSRGQKETTRRPAKGPGVLRAVVGLRQILEEGRLTSSQPDREGRRDIRMVHTFEAPIELAGEPFRAIAHVWEMRDGNFHYDLGLIRPEGGGAAARSPKGPKLPPAGGMTDTHIDGSDLNIGLEPLRGNAGAVADNGDYATREQRAPLMNSPAGRGIRPYPKPTPPGTGSMMANVSVPDRRIWDELTNNNVRLAGRLEGARGAGGDLVDSVRVQLQDRMLSLLRAQQAVEAATGERLAESENAYRTEELFAGKVGRRLDEGLYQAAGFAGGRHQGRARLRVSGRPRL